MAGNKPPLYSGKYKARELLSVQGVNLLTYSQEFQQPIPAWGKHACTVQSNVVLSPDDTQTGDKIVTNTGVNKARIGQGIKPIGYTGQTPLNVPYTFSVHLSPGEFKYVALRVASLSAIGADTDTNPNDNEVYGTFSHPSHFTVVFDLTAGLATNQLATVSASLLNYKIDFAENGWQRLTVTGIPNTHIESFSSPASSNVRAYIIPLNSSTETPITDSPIGNGSNGLYVWGAQLERDTEPSTYTKTENKPEWKVYRYGGQAGNLIYYSQNFSVSGNQAGWYRTNIGQILSGVEISPRGLLEASKIIENNATGKHQLYHDTSQANRGLYTASIYAKKAERRYLQMSQDHTTVPAIFDLQEGIITQNGGFQPYIKNVGGGWYRCEIVYVNNPGPDFKIMSFGISDSPTGNASYTGNSTSGIFVWGAQVERTGWAGEQVVTEGAPFTRLSHYDFSNQETVEPSLTMPYNLNHLYWSDIFDDERSTWNLSNGATIVLQRPEITNTQNGDLVPINVRLSDSLNLASNLIEGTTSSLEGFSISQTHEIKYDWDQSYDGRYTFSVFLKGGITNPLRRYVRLDLDALTLTNVFFGRVATVIDLLDGSIEQPAEAVGNAFVPTCEVENKGDGWYRVKLTGFFGEPNNLITAFNNDKLQTFLSEDITTFAQILKDFDIRGVKQIRPRITICNGPDFNNIEYTGNGTNYIQVWGAQLEHGPKATAYTTNTTGKSRSYDGSLTRVKPNTIYYFPIVRFARDEKTFAFQIDATYDRTRRTTGNDTLILYNNKIGFNNPNPTFSVDISGSLGATRATMPAVSTAALKGSAGLDIKNYSDISINSSVSMGSGVLTPNTLIATDIVAATTVYYFSSLNIPVPVNQQEFSNLLIDPDLITKNFNIDNELSGKNITARETFGAPILDAARVNVGSNFLPQNGTVFSNIAPKNLLNYTENFNNSYWLAEETTITTDATTAPDGTATAERFLERSTSSWPRVSNRSIYTTSDRTYIYSVHAKYSGSQYFAIDIRENRTTLSVEQLVTPRVGIIFDIQNGTIAVPLTSTTSTQAISAGIVPLADNWYRLAIVFKPNIAPLTPRDPSNLTIRHSILGNINSTTINAFFTVLEPPLLAGQRDVDPTQLRFTGNTNNGVLLWGAQLEYADHVPTPTLTKYEKVETPILPDIYTNRVVGKVPIDPALTNPVGYTPTDDLRVDRDINVVFGIKPSDSFSTDNPTIVRALTGDWDYDHNADELGVSRPFFKNWWGVIDYVRSSGLSFGNSLTIYVYEDILGNSAPVNPSPWSNTPGDPLYNPSRYNATPTTSADPSGLLLMNTATGTRLARRWGGGTSFQCDVYSTEWLGANYPALTAAGLRGGTYIWRNGGELVRQDTSLWIPGRAFEFRRDINYSEILVQGLYNIKPRIGNATPPAPAVYNAPNNEYLAYYIKDKPFDAPPTKLVTRAFVCQDRLKNFQDGDSVKTTTNGGRGYFGPDNGDPSLFLSTQYYIDEDDNAGRIDRAHLAIFDMRPTTNVTFKNISLEQQTNATDATPIAWCLGNFTFVNTTVVNQTNTMWNHWGLAAYEEGFSSNPEGKFVYNGDYQIDPYLLTPQTWNSDAWKTVIGARSRAYMPGYGLAVVGSLPHTIVNGVTANPFKPVPGWSFFVTPFERNASSTFSDTETPGRQFGRNSHMQSSLILDGEWCQQRGNNHMTLFYKSRQTSVKTDGYIFKGDHFKWHNYRVELSAIGINDRGRTVLHGLEGGYARNVFLPVRAYTAFSNLFTTNVGMAPWTLSTTIGILPSATPYPGTALYKKYWTHGTWETSWFVGKNSDMTLASYTDYDPPIIDFTGYMSPQDWIYQQTTNTIKFTTLTTNVSYTIPTLNDNLEPSPALDLDYGTANYQRFHLAVDGYEMSRVAFKVKTANRELTFAEPWATRYSSSIGRDITLGAILTAVRTYQYFISATNVQSLNIEPGPKLTSTSSDYRVTRVQNIADGAGQFSRPYTRTYTVLPTTDYTVNSATRVIDFTSPIPITQVTNTNQLSGRGTYNCYTQIVIEQLNVAQGSELVLTWHPSNSTAFTQNLLNSIIEQKPYWVRTENNRLILSGHRSPNDMDSYRNFYTIESPLSTGLFSTLSYYTSTYNI